MSALRVAALALVVAGILSLAYGGFTYTRTTHDAKIGPFELSIKDKERVSIPIWAGVGAILLGGATLLTRAKT